MTPKLLKYPHPGLREKANHVDNKDEACNLHIQSMIGVLYSESGLGLASTQVEGFNCRIIIIRTLFMGDEQPIVMINPEIIKTTGDLYPSREGCLSFPKIFGSVPRYQSLTVKYENEEGEIVETLTYGEFAETIQHEIDHLDGVLFIDKMSKKDLKKNRAALKKLKKKFKKD